MIANPMTARETFDSFYTRKLDALKIELKAVIKGDIPYPVSDFYKCVQCQGRMFLHTMEGQILCLLCKMPTVWPDELKRRVSIILESYPSLEASHCEWEALQRIPTPRETRSKARVRAGDVELGRKIRAARVQANLSQEELARLLIRKNGRRFTQSAIKNYETGEAKPTAYVMEQLKQVLGLKG